MLPSCSDSKLRAPGGPRGQASSTLAGNLSFDELCEKDERFLPAEIAGLGRNGIRYPFLHYVQLSTARDLLQGYSRLHFSGQIRVVEFVRVANAFVWHQLKILSAERVAMARGEVCERHLVGTADFRIQMVNLAGKAIRREPFGHCVGIEKRPIDSLGRSTEHTVEPDDVCGHDHFASRCVCDA